MKTKTCSICGVDHQIDYYYTIQPTAANPDRKPYTYTYCKFCHYQKYTKKTAANWRVKNPKAWRAVATKAMKAYLDRDRAGVYCIMTDKGLYIGSSENMHFRVTQHANNETECSIIGRGATIIDWVVIAEESDKEKRLALEKQWIQFVRPALNRQYNPDYSPTRYGKYIKKK